MYVEIIQVLKPLILFIGSEKHCLVTVDVLARHMYM